MQRKIITPRDSWKTRVEGQGLLYHTHEQGPYWNESAFYQFSIDEILKIESATNELYEMCLKAAEHVISNNLYHQYGLSAQAKTLIEASWESEPPSLYGRFDLAYLEDGSVKLLEFNADTPTALLEAAVVQWYWKQDLYPFADQFNSIHEKLIAQWTSIAEVLSERTVHFAHMDDWEDWMTVSYLRDTAAQAGISSGALLMEELGWNEGEQQFRDLDERQILSLFKLYPWEWLLDELPIKCGGLIESNQINIIEPAWRMLWSNKALLATLWELFPDHPLLLTTYLDEPQDMVSYARKPLLSREGSNIQLVRNGEMLAQSSGPYDTQRCVYQALAKIPEYQGNYPILGSWYITDQGAAGIGVRESSNLVTDNLSRFVPHIIKD